MRPDSNRPQKSHQRSWIAIAATALALTLPVTAGAQHYVAFGDSITSGFGDSEERLVPGYPGRLAERMPEAQIEVFGLGGEKTPDALTRFCDTITGRRGATLLLMEGTNDISVGISHEATIFNLRQIANKAAFRGMSVALATVIPRLPSSSTDFDSHATERLNQRIRDLAGNESHGLVDNFQAFYGVPRLFADNYYDGFDPVGHPNPSGYDIMADTFEAVLTDVDTAPPVPGVMSPENREQRVGKGTDIELDIWDFGEGIDLSSVQLFMNGTDTGAMAIGNARRADITFDSATALPDVVRLRLVASDLASPPNTFDREISVFVTGPSTVFLEGDINRDGRVDGRDVIRLGRSFGVGPSSRRWDRASDLNDDGIVDGSDLGIVAENFGLSS